ncbi:hypothetical protein PIG80_07775 [Streptococcus thermophilus]|uniref:hypothetical protein n=1 Tax=Streptococcus thermophilus TaxID=1308 RepID=UPI0022FDD1DC|nr:hypothetical protein [Streptococcus thermophilus]MDA5554947.1 hypothetical protein [Streptococcus thermophilus]
MYTKSLSCGILAGEWLFGENNFEVLPNSFCTEKFKFDSAERKKVREKLGIDNKLVIGHIGRFNEQKNQAYLSCEYLKNSLQRIVISIYC